MLARSGKKGYPPKNNFYLKPRKGPAVKKLEKAIKEKNETPHGYKKSRKTTCSSIEKGNSELKQPARELLKSRLEAGEGARPD